VLFRSKKTLQRKLNSPGKRRRIVQELKGTGTTIEIKKYFYDLVRPVDFHLYTIILNKTRVYKYLTERQSRVYNYVTRILLKNVPLEEASTRVQLTIDKSKTRPEIRDFNAYILKELESKISPGVPLTITHENSCEAYGLQAVDMFFYGVFDAFERKRWGWFNTFKEKVSFWTVYLPDK